MDIVLGAGIVGTSVALHLQARGRDVALIDRAAPGSGTSMGNAGLIERTDMMPRAFPRAFGEIAQYALGTDIRVQFDWPFMPRLAPWLFSYWRNSAPKPLARIADEIGPLFIHSLAEYQSLLAAAGLEDSLRHDGWLHLFRDGDLPPSMHEGIARARDAGMTVDVLTPDAIAEREPALKQRFAAGVHWRDSASIADPGGMTAGLAAHFAKKGGTLVTADAATLRQQGAGWQVDTPDGPLSGENAVIALGPWAGDLARRLGYRFPLGVKRGYHMHYAPDPANTPTLPIIDVANGYVVNPMTRGLRLTTAIEFAPRDAAPHPRQLARAEPLARQILPLGDRVDAAPWMGARPCTSDMKPIMGPAPRHKGLWFACGHAHHGLTLGPVSGRLVAELICGETPVVPHTPFLPARFG